MEFGLFNLSPQRDPRRSPREVLAQTIDEALHAEDLGFDVVWIAEHHFSNLSLSPSPLMLAGHLAGMTKRIGLGTGVVVLPLYQPLRLVEEIAYVDMLSDGRLRLGVGCGSQNHESRGFDTDIGEARDRFVEFMDIIDMALAEGRVAYEGRHFRVPATMLSLSPVQQPGPPIYLAGLASDAEITERIARKGYIPFASAQWLPVAAVRAKRAGYEAGYRAAGLDPCQMPFAIQRMIYVTDDKADALNAAEHARYTHRVVASVKGASPIFDGHVIQEQAIEGEDSPEAIMQAAMIGDAEKCARMIVGDIEALGLTHMSCFMNFGGLEPARVRRSMEHFARDVMPMVAQALGEDNSTEAVSRARDGGA